MFGNFHREHMRRMEHMMDNFMNPFENLFSQTDMGFPRLMGPGAALFPQHPRREQPQRPSAGGGLVPFGFNHGGLMLPMFGDISRMTEDMNQNPNAHSFSSASVMTYTTGEDGKPKIYQASKSTRMAPGGVKEVRKTVADSEAGIKKMAIGHHLDEKGHVIEKTQYVNSGELEENQEFINLQEEEAESFNREWVNKARQGFGAGGNNIRPVELPGHRHRRHHTPEVEDHPQMRAILPPPQRKRDHDGENGGYTSEKSRRKNQRSKVVKEKPQLEEA